jgi:hypothetical protein
MITTQSRGQRRLGRLGSELISDLGNDLMRDPSWLKEQMSACRRTGPDPKPGSPIERPGLIGLKSQVTWAD